MSFSDSEAYNDEDRKTLDVATVTVGGILPGPDGIPLPYKLQLAVHEGGTDPTA